MKLWNIKNKKQKNVETVDCLLQNNYLKENSKTLKRKNLESQTSVTKTYNKTIPLNVKNEDFKFEFPEWINENSKKIIISFYFRTNNIISNLTGKIEDSKLFINDSLEKNEEIVNHNSKNKYLQTLPSLKKENFIENVLIPEQKSKHKKLQIFKNMENNISIEKIFATLKNEKTEFIDLLNINEKIYELDIYKESGKYLIRKKCFN